MNFSVRQSLQSSFKIFSQNTSKVILLSALSLAFFLLIQGVSAFIIITIFQDFSRTSFSAVSNVSKSFIILFILFRDIIFLLQSMVLLFLTNAFLPAFKGHKVEFKNYFTRLKKTFLFALGASLFLVVPTICSILAVFVPNYEVLQRTLSAIAVVVSIMLLRYFFFYIELLAGCPLSTSLKSSSLATKGNFFGVAFLLVALILINFFVMFSVYFFGIMMIVFILFALPISVLILADVYNQLTKRHYNDASQEKALSIEDEVMESTEKELI